MPKIKSKSLEGWTYESWTEDFIKDREFTEIDIPKISVKPYKLMKFVKKVRITIKEIK